MLFDAGLRLGVVVSIVALKRGETGQSTSDEHRTRLGFPRLTKRCEQGALTMTEPVAVGARHRSTLPATVVRFYGNVDYALDTIAHQQIIFIHASRLNDPFDPYFFFETDFDDSYEQLLAWVEKKHPDDLKWFRHVTADSLGKAVDVVQTGMKNLRDTSFVFSCSAVTRESHPKDNLYMWGHYGNGHRGVALEFDSRKVASLFVERYNKATGDKATPESAWVRIEYEAKLAGITCSMFFDFFRNQYEQGQRRTSLQTYIEKASHVKSLVWKREKEWWLFRRLDGTRLKVHRELVPPDAIAAVYVGLSTPPGSEADIVFETHRKFPNAKIYRAHKKLGFTELEFTQTT